MMGYGPPAVDALEFPRNGPMSAFTEHRPRAIRRVILILLLTVGSWLLVSLPAYRVLAAVDTFKWTPESLEMLRSTCRVRVALPAFIPDGYAPEWGGVNLTCDAYCVVYVRGECLFIVGMQDGAPTCPGKLCSVGSLSRYSFASSGLKLRGTLEQDASAVECTWRSMGDKFYYVHSRGMTPSETRRIVASLHFLPSSPRVPTR